MSSYGQSNTEKITLIERYLSKSKTLSQKNNDSAFYFLDKALSLSKKIVNDTLIVKTQLQKSSLFLTSNKLHLADSILKTEIQKQLPLHLEGVILHNLGTIDYKKQRFEKALNYYVESARKTEKSNNQKLLGNTYANIGIINAQLKNFDKAQTYLEKAIDLLKNKELFKLQLLVNLSNIYKEQKLFSKFENSIFKAEKLAIKNNSKRTLSIIYNNLSDYYTNKKKLDKAIIYGKESILLKKELKQTNNLSLTYNNVGHSYLKKKAFKNAIVYLDSALPNSKGLLKSYVYNNLKDAYLGLANYKKAVLYAELKDTLKDSLNNANQKEKVTEIIEKYESEKKEQQISLLNTTNELQQSKIINQKNLMLGGVLALAFVSLLAFFWYKNQKIKQALNQASLQHKLLRTQLNPHFLFHSLNSIQSFIYQNRKDISLNYLASYSKLMRFIFDSISKDFITVQEDIDAMKEYLELQKLNLNTNIKLELVADNGIENYLIPPMFIQPFIENAIQHGIKGLKNGEVKVSCLNDNNAIKVVIFDNGKGLKNKNNNTLFKKESSSKIIEQRILNLQNTFHYSITKKVSSTTDGTTITLLFPKKKAI